MTLDSKAATRSESSAVAPRSVDVTSVLNRPQLGQFRWRVIFMCWLIAVVDGFDVQAMAFVAPVLSDVWGISRPVMGQVLTASLFGLMLGSMILGRASDHFGRRPVLIGSVLLFSIGSLLTALSETPLQLILTRCFTGFGLGGAVVAALALTAEYAPARSRARIVTAMFVGFPLGGSIGGVLAMPLISSVGWQGVFVFGGLVPLALIAVIRRFLPESLQFCVSKGIGGQRIGEIVQRIDPRYQFREGDRFQIAENRAGSSSLGELFVQARLPGTLLIWLICFANLLVLYLLINWLPSILHQSGLSLARANLGAVIFNLGGVIGGLALSFAVDRLGAFRVLAIGYALTAAAILALARTQNTSIAFGLTIFAGAGVIGSQFCINALASAFYPTAVRSTGVGWALGIGRIGSILGPLVGGFALASGATMAAIFSGAALPIVVCSVAVMLLSIAYRRAAIMPLETGDVAGPSGRIGELNTQESKVG